jgi:hypothetical protein
LGVKVSRYEWGHGRENSTIQSITHRMLKEKDPEGISRESNVVIRQGEV